MSAVATAESRTTFPCFGGECTVIVADAARATEAGRAVALARDQLLRWHAQFTRFEQASELSRLNADPRATIPVTPMMRRVIAAVLDAAYLTGGLVDCTLLSEIEDAGYDRHFEGSGLPLNIALASAPPRAPAHPHPSAHWRTVQADRRSGTVTRPRGVRLDPGGIAKGVFADELASKLSTFDAFAIDCAGDIRIGGAAGLMRPVHVESPFDGSVLHTFQETRTALATSGIGRRSWTGSDGRPAHHLLDPATGRPAFTGIVQASACAPAAARAEALSKAALLSGPDHARDWLGDGGGLLVFDDGSHQIVEPAA